MSDKKWKKTEFFFFSLVNKNESNLFIKLSQDSSFFCHLWCNNKTTWIYFAWCQLIQLRSISTRSIYNKQHYFTTLISSKNWLKLIHVLSECQQVCSNISGISYFLFFVQFDRIQWHLLGKVLATTYPGHLPSSITWKMCFLPTIPVHLPSPSYKTFTFDDKGWVPYITTRMC